MPTVEVGCLLVVVVKHLRQYLLVVGVAESLRRSANPLFGISLDGEVGQLGGLDVLAAASVLARNEVSYTYKIRLLDVLPAILELLCRASAALREACVAYLVAFHKYLSAGFVYSLCNVGACSLCYALIALAVVVGTHVKDGMVLAVVPLDKLVVLSDEGEESVLSGTCLLLAALLYLRQQPTA